MHEGDEAGLETLTHARLRVAQGDRCGAAAILRRILGAHPDCVEARRILAALGDPASTAAEPPEEPLLPPPDAQRAGELRDRFRRALSGEVRDPHGSIRRLEAWLARLQRRA